MLDKYYTPSSLVEFMLDKVSIHDVRFIADFTAGDGALLIAARKRYPNSHLIAVDIDENSLLKIQQNISKKVSFFVQDFVSAGFSEYLKFEIDLVLMNPPFSLKVQRKFDELFALDSNANNFKIYGSLVFVLKALQYLSAAGQLIAILPESILFSERDRVAWEYLQLHHEVVLFDDLPLYSFSNCQPNVICVSIKKRTKISILDSGKSEESQRLDVPFEIFRGSLSPKKALDAKDSKVHLIHTSNLKNNQLVNVKSIAPGSFRRFTSPCIVLPRVGRFDARKVVFIKGEGSFVLSDCVIAIKPNEGFDIDTLYAILIDNIEFLKLNYHGTGAVYITKDRLHGFLKSNILSAL